MVAAGHRRGLRDLSLPDALDMVYADRAERSMYPYQYQGRDRHDPEAILRSFNEALGLVTPVERARRQRLAGGEVVIVSKGG